MVLFLGAHLSSPLFALALQAGKTVNYSSIRRAELMASVCEDQWKNNLPFPTRPPPQVL